MEALTRNDQAGVGSADDASFAPAPSLERPNRSTAPHTAAPRGTRNELVAQLEAQVPSTAGHSRRVSRLAAEVARRMGLPAEEVARVRSAAALRDIGKSEVPEAIIGDPDLAAIVRHRHERFDGEGCPDRLAGAAIPLGARIVAVADTFDAVTRERPNRPVLTHGEALALLDAVAGTQLDPAVVAAFRSNLSWVRLRGLLDSAR
jgi:HD-GYP domain-containing protein (c-di-GMP phosphodiesterase class II)